MKTNKNTKQKIIKTAATDLCVISPKKAQIILQHVSSTEQLFNINSGTVIINRT